MTDVLFALMVLKSCENAKLFIATSHQENCSQYKEVKVKLVENSLLSLVKEIEMMKETNALFSTSKNSNLDKKVEVLENTFFPVDLLR